MLLCVDPRYDVNAARVVVLAFEAVASQHRDDSTASEDPDARIVALQRLSEIHRSECTGRRSNRPPTGAGGPARVSIRAEALASLYRLRGIYRDVLSDDSDSASARPSHDAVALAVKVAVADAEVPSLVGERVNALRLHLVCLRDSVSLAGCLSVY